ncbi:MAG: HEAT repeat domain-containing protein, partial [Verrucomicrobiota bacterium]
FIGDAGGNLVHRKIIYPDGVGVLAARPADEQKIEFLASRDTWFRPVQFANAPDGTLYVIDMYREVIEHPWSLPEQIKKHLDLNSGNDRGRIYRIVPDTFKQPKQVRFGEATTAQLVSALESPNGWHRDTASRLLYQRQDKSAVPFLTNVVQKSRFPLARMHALYALIGLDSLDAPTIALSLRDTDETVRQHAVRLSEKFLQDARLMTNLFAALQPLAKDPSMKVRYQLAFTLGDVKLAEKIPALAEIVRRDPTNMWIRAAVLSSLADGTGEMFVLLFRDAAFSGTKDGQDFLSELAGIIGAKNQPKEVTAVVDRLAATDNPPFVFPLLRSFSDGLKHSGVSPQSLAGYFQPVFARALEIAADQKTDEALRIQAIQLLALTTYGESAKNLLALLDQNQSQAIQIAAVEALGQFSDAAASVDLIQRFPAMTPQVRSATLTVLLSRPERIIVLLNSLNKGSIRAGDLSSAQIKFLRNNNDNGIRERATKAFMNVGMARREDVVKTFQPALALSGNAARGKVIYSERCLSCHRFENVGFALGPDMVTAKNSGKEKMLINILDPNREVAPNYRAFEVETKNEETLIGLVANETATSVTLRQAYGKESTILRSQIKKLQSQEQSLMPEGLEAGLKPQDLADLLEYISR